MRLFIAVVLNMWSAINPATSTSPGNELEIQILSLHVKYTKQKLGLEPSICVISMHAEVQEPLVYNNTFETNIKGLSSHRNSIHLWTY